MSKGDGYAGNQGKEMEGGTRRGVWCCQMILVVLGNLKRNQLLIMNHDHLLISKEVHPV